MPGSGRPTPLHGKAEYGHARDGVGGLVALMKRWHEPRVQTLFFDSAHGLDLQVPSKVAAGLDCWLAGMPASPRVCLYPSAGLDPTCIAVMRDRCPAPELYVYVDSGRYGHWDDLASAYNRCQRAREAAHWPWAPREGVPWRPGRERRTLPGLDARCLVPVRVTFPGKCGRLNGRRRRFGADGFLGLWAEGRKTYRVLHLNDNNAFVARELAELGVDLAYVFWRRSEYHEDELESELRGLGVVPDVVKFGGS